MPNTFSIVFVHGLNPSGHENHAEHTWTHHNGTFWLEQLLPQSLPSARILLFSYNSRVFSEVSTASIRHHADSLLDRLHGARIGYAQTIRPIIFVCHSLGGLLVKQALVSAKVKKLYRDIAEATYGLVFFGTPHRGGNGVTLGKCVANIMSAITGELQGSLLSTLEKNSVLNDDICDNFCLQKEEYEVVTFYETLPMKIKFEGWFQWLSQSARMVIVDRASAKLGAAEEVVLDLNADHSNLCKFESLDDEGYKIVVRHLKGLVDRAMVKYTVRHDDVEISS
ncbi:hypothetical protein K440DRAFT_319374 [Wilcoxina mikolae CBS 423.85]|nr:hypothetical protein K440DRAFT_319374 [Wilcoxina mikolae CBS 423.85]